MKLTQSIVAILILFWTTPVMVSAQNATDKLYAMKGYSSAVQKLEAKAMKSTEDIIKIANSYRLNHDTQNAAAWYKQVVDKSSDPLNFLYYAQALQSNGDFEEAKKYYLLFNDKIGAEKDDKRGKLLAAAIDRMNEMNAPGKVVIENVASINTEYHEFSPVMYKGGLIFVSNRDEDSENNYKDNWMNSKFLNLYFSELSEDGTFSSPENYSANLNSDYHEGPSCFNRSGNQIFFSQNQHKKGRRINSKAGIMKNDIFFSTKVGASWSSPEKLPFNTAEYEEVHPSLSIDGQFLIFASDRKGGYGGMDIYISRKMNGEWQAPKNLGEQVNTPGNEIFPFVQADNSLYFSSDGWGGVGGLDIFKIELVDHAPVNSAQNLGQPFNSTMDDFGFISNLLGTEGYFSSDRAEGKGKDDIYKFSANVVEDEDLMFLKDLCFADQNNGNRLDGVHLEVKELDLNGVSKPIMPFYKKADTNSFTPGYLIDPQNTASSKLESFTTGPGGDMSLQLVQGKKYFLEANKTGYSNFTQELNLTEERKDGVSGCYLLSSIKLPTLTITGQVLDQLNGNPIANASIDILEPCLNTSKTILTDAQGKYTWTDAKCQCELKVNGSKENYYSSSESTGQIYSTCSRGGIIHLDLALAEKKHTTKIGVGTYMELKNIFYDFNKSYIRSTASTDLDQLARVMKSYPSMEIELASHTDARGSKRYNLKLSQRRAEAAVNYLIKKGISPERLVAIGYGESKLKNQCANNVDCNEEEHQLNRRTEIRILKLRESVDVKQVDNWPIIIR